MSLIWFAIARSRFLAWLALLAMLLLFIAPVISKSLMAQHGYASPMMMAHMSAMVDQPLNAARSGCAAGVIRQHSPPAVGHAQHAEHPRHHTAVPDNAASSCAAPHPRHYHMSMMDDSACGYCVLLIHLPLDSVRLPQLWTLLQAAIPATPLRLQPFVASWIPIWFRPRGPPVNGFSPV
ncbi:hypothetical protein J2X14_001798 [Pantoea alhagi]|uniref:DUF2946 family protein n=1 Tax=Mixta sp. BE291 TaxID=3158787 RepID=UPI002864DD79|nr:hypothetical protein [Pantoea alhagi]